MITKLNLTAPPPSQIQRVNLIKLAPPLVPQAQYCAVVSARKGERLACAIIHPYHTAHLYVPAFPTLLPRLQAEVWPNRHLADTVWIDVVYTNGEGARPQLLVRSTRIENATTELVWGDRDFEFVKAWESHVSFAIDVLCSLGARPGKSWSRLLQVCRATAMRYWRLGQGAK
jgi:hypothetical protein